MTQGNSHLFKERKRPSLAPYKKKEVSAIASTIGTSDDIGVQAVVLVKQDSKLYTPMLFGIFDTRIEALQSAHYINANMILRNGDPLPMHLTAEDDTLAGLKEKGYAL